jgi:guanine nucleotide-binding protein subunit beta-2-like 1 protein
MSAEKLTLRGTLEGHGDWITSLATTPEDPNLLLSSSRDKSVIVWTLTHSSDSYGFAKRALKGFRITIVGYCLWKNNTSLRWS